MDAGPARRFSTWCAVAALTLLPGCVQSTLFGPGSTLEVTCLVLDAEGEPTLVLEWLTAPESSYSPGPVMQRAAAALGNATGRPPTGVVVREAEAPPTPPGGWNATSLRAWATGPIDVELDAPPRLRVLWVLSFSPEPATGLLAAPGTVVVATLAVLQGAEHLSRPVDEVARAVLLHHLGHALGQTNDGVPVQARDIQEREGPPRHDRDPASVLHAGWEDARTMMWAPDATYDRYAAASLADWRAAWAPGGVCA